MIDFLKKIHARAVGINRRNLHCIYPNNPRRRFPEVDDKILSKELLRRAGIAVSPTLEILEHQGQIAEFFDNLKRWTAFALKPASGSGGRGLKIGKRAPGGAWVDHAGRPLDRMALAFHLAAILNGEYSLSSEHDRVLVETLLVDNETLSDIHGGSGLSDTRIIAHRGRAVMAMLRMPCRGSGGAANLHAGGLGLGIDLDSGRTTHATRHGLPIERHPDTRADLAGIVLPGWRAMLDIAGKINRAFGMDYLGVDLVHDRVLGPLVLEVNARPGLEIQLANRRGLRAAIGTLP
jgi:alpha-L-glutamate ligase-like protein